MTEVSVVIPYFNRAQWLELAVDSVLGQTFQDFEVIVVDDGSEERTVLRDSATDPRIRYVRQEHQGASAARNHGVRLARGKYVAFLDADDLFEPNKLTVQVGQMQDMPDVALSHTSYRRIDATGNDLEDVRSGTFSGVVYPSIVTQCPIATPTVMVRKDVFDAQGLEFPESVASGEDTMLWIDFARWNRILGIDQVLAKVRIHGRNAYSNPRVQYEAGLEILERAFQRDPSFPLAFRRRALARVCIAAGHSFLLQGDRSRALRCVARGVAFWPFDSRSVLFFAVLLLPHKVRMGLRRLRNRVIRRDGPARE
jgi:hypothetical protein